jgi:anti-sigma B factor antagonist
MSDTPHSAEAIQVAWREETAFVRVAGPGSFRISPALKQFGQSMLGRGVRRLVVDMRLCTAADSTFMGVLAGLAMRLRQQPAGRMILSGLRADVATRFTALGLNRVIDLLPAGGADATGPAPADLRPLPIGGAGPAESRVRAETALAAHEDLAGACPDNALRFKDVMAFLREDLRRMDESGGQEPGKNAG